MVIFAEKFGELHNLENLAYKLVSQFPDFFSASNFLAINWKSFVEITSYNLKCVNQFADYLRSVGGGKSFTSVCEFAEIVNFPEALQRIGVTELYCPFWVDDEAAFSLLESGITIRAFPSDIEHPIDLRELDKRCLLQVRSLGKLGKQIELTLIDVAGLHELNPKKGSLLFEESAVIEQQTIASAQLLEHPIYNRALCKGNIIVGRVPNKLKGRVFWDALKVDAVPILPGAPTYLKSDNLIFNSLIFHSSRKLTSQNEDDLTISSFIENFLSHIQQLKFCYSGKMGIAFDVIQDAFKIKNASPSYLNGCMNSSIQEKLECFPFQIDTALLMLINKIILRREDIYPLILDTDTLRNIVKKYDNSEMDVKIFVKNILQEHKVAWLLWGTDD
ncbi:hypothetical protein OPS25_06045 [Alteromonas ponticola]|uniref:Uncharacterized protein n=1 Tax=Alteromonas aquimaris TaxID=2998417 RepID=A0ABT3P5L6_9ALTE|nr:hypothetical protein [Alteromonas aquimaris]MCW8108055.1 hypothetical protein [Alteromonas aquimaris]